MLRNYSLTLYLCILLGQFRTSRIFCDNTLSHIPLSQSIDVCQSTAVSSLLSPCLNCLKPAFFLITTLARFHQNNSPRCVLLFIPEYTDVSIRSCCFNAVQLNLVLCFPRPCLTIIYQTTRTKCTYSAFQLREKQTYKCSGLIAPSAELR